ncbi:hypothetical protein SUDANB58_04337 [Streptomyces sp. enrichment culture]|uniref:hypothetical protein n=1 Tax=Streptomyces sp. enrichment culture TaxID=1795815 RepID=UPI003F560BD2
MLLGLGRRLLRGSRLVGWLLLGLDSLRVAVTRLLRWVTVTDVPGLGRLLRVAVTGGLRLSGIRLRGVRGLPRVDRYRLSALRRRVTRVRLLSRMTGLLDRAERALWRELMSGLSGLRLRVAVSGGLPGCGLRADGRGLLVRLPCLLRYSLDGLCGHEPLRQRRESLVGLGRRGDLLGGLRLLFRRRGRGSGRHGLGSGSHRLCTRLCPGFRRRRRGFGFGLCDGVRVGPDVR